MEKLTQISKLSPQEYGERIIKMVHDITPTDEKFLMQIYTIMHRHMEKQNNLKKGSEMDYNNSDSLEETYKGAIIKMVKKMCNEKMLERVYKFVMYLYVHSN